LGTIAPELSQRCSRITDSCPFPLLLLLVTGLGFVVGHNPDLEHRIVHSALGEFPIIGDQLGKSVHALRGSGVGLIVGLLGLIWGSLGVSQPPNTRWLRSGTFRVVSAPGSSLD
jgi:hypothetical protein